MGSTELNVIAHSRIFKGRVRIEVVMPHGFLNLHIRDLSLKSYFYTIIIVF